MIGSSTSVSGGHTPAPGGRPGIEDQIAAVGPEKGPGLDVEEIRPHIPDRSITRSIRPERFL